MDISAKDLATRLIQLASRPPSPLQGQQETQTKSDSEKSIRNQETPRTHITYVGFL